MYYRYIVIMCSYSRVSLPIHNTTHHQQNHRPAFCTQRNRKTCEPMSSKLEPSTLQFPSLIFHCLADLRHQGLILDDRSAVASTTGPDRSSKANANLR